MTFLKKVSVKASSQALHMVSFEIFVKSMPPGLSELKVTPSFCFTFKIPDNPTTTSIYYECIYLFTSIELLAL